MQETTSKEKILKRIREALIEETPKPYPYVESDKRIYPEIQEDVSLYFAQKLIDNGGFFVYCSNQTELMENLRALFQKQAWKTAHTNEHFISSILLQAGIGMAKQLEEQNQTVSITGCEYLIARYGSILVSSKQLSGRKSISYPEYHIVIAGSRQIVIELEDALAKMKEKYEVENFPSMISLISGPSRTADIEKIIVKGAHGPKNVVVFVVDNE